MKKQKKDDSGFALRESVYNVFYQSADKSYDALAWIQNKDYSFNLQSSQKQEIDQLLNISFPHNSDQKHGDDPPPEENQKIPFQLCSDSKSVPLSEENLQINKQLETAECELNNSKVKQDGDIQVKQSVSRSVEQQFDIPLKEEQPKESSISSLSNFPTTFQAQSLFIQDIIEKYAKKREQNLSGAMTQQPISPKTTDTQDLKSTPLFQPQPEPQVGKKKAPTRTRKKQGKNRIQQIEDEKSEPKNIQEQFKVLSQSQSLNLQVFNLNQKWAKMKNRKDARKYEIYQTQLYKDFFKLVPLYLHQSEGEIKLDEPKKRDKKGIFQSFELLINPKILIGPLSVKKSFKLHIRFKKGFAGQVFYDNKLQNAIPTNPVEYVTIEEEPLILANNSDNIVKLVCCLIFDTNQ